MRGEQQSVCSPLTYFVISMRRPAFTHPRIVHTAHPGCTKCTKCTISAPPPFLDIKSPVYLPGAGGGREGGVPGHPPGAPPCTRSCERLGSKAPKNTLFRGLSTPPGPPPPGIPGGEKPPFFTPFHPHPPTPPDTVGNGGARGCAGVRGGVRGCAGSNSLLLRVGLTHTSIDFGPRACRLRSR